MTQVIVSIGECMVELASVPGDALYKRGFAGDTFNTAWYLRQRLGGEFDIAYLTGVGDDRISQDMLAFITASSVSTSRIKVLPGKTAGLYMITLDGVERSFTYWRETAAARMIARDPVWLADQIGDAAAVYFSGITLAILGEDRAAFLDVLSAYRAAGGRVMFDPNIRLRLWSDREEAKAWISQAYRLSDIALPTFEDDAALFGDADLDATATRLANLGVNEMVVKDGASPCLVIADGVRDYVSAQKVTDAVDTTGAGDSFNAGYLAARLKGLTPLQSAAEGHRVAGEVIRHRGALVTLPDAV